MLIVQRRLNVLIILVRTVAACWMGWSSPSIHWIVNRLRICSVIRVWHQRAYVHYSTQMSCCNCNLISWTWTANCILAWFSLRLAYCSFSQFVIGKYLENCLISLGSRMISWWAIRKERFFVIFFLVKYQLWYLKLWIDWLLDPATTLRYFTITWSITEFR
jgi:hypothetical protein